MRDLTSAAAGPPGDEDHARGPQGAPQLVFYGDFTCAQCAVAAVALRQMDLRVHFRHFAMSSRDRRSVPLAAACEAAGLQGAFWEFHDTLFEDPGHTDDPHLWERCRNLGIDIERFDADRRSEETLNLVRAQTSEALRAGAISTPAYLFEGELHSELPGALNG